MSLPCLSVRGVGWEFKNGCMQEVFTIRATPGERACFSLRVNAHAQEGSSHVIGTSDFSPSSTLKHAYRAVSRRCNHHSHASNVALRRYRHLHEKVALQSVRARESRRDWKVTVRVYANCTGPWQVIEYASSFGIVALDASVSFAVPLSLAAGQCRGALMRPRQWRSMRFMRRWFIFRNREPLQKVCCGADTHARSQTASLGRTRLPPLRSNNMAKRKVLRPDGGVSMSLHIRTARTLSRAPRLLPLCPQTSSPSAHWRQETGRYMLSMRSMRGGFIFRSQGPSLKVHHSQYLASMTKHDTGGLPPGAACDSTKPPHGKARGSISGWRSRLGPFLPNGHFPKRPDYYSCVRGLQLRCTAVTEPGLQEATRRCVPGGVDSPALCQVKLDLGEDQPANK